MNNTIRNDFRTRPPLAAQPPTRSFRRNLGRIGGWLFAACDAEAGWRGWDVHERRLGLARRYHDQRFGRFEPSPATWGVE